MFNFVRKHSQRIGGHPLTDTLFLQIAWKYKPSQPIGDHPLWPCPLRVISNFVRRSHTHTRIYIYIYLCIYIYICVCVCVWTLAVNMIAYLEYLSSYDSIFQRSTSAFLSQVYGGVPKKDQLPALRAGAPILVATPGRLNDFLEWPGGCADFTPKTASKHVEKIWETWRKEGKHGETYGKHMGTYGNIWANVGEMGIIWDNLTKIGEISRVRKRNPWRPRVILPTIHRNFGGWRGTFQNGLCLLSKNGGGDCNI